MDAVIKEEAKVLSEEDISKLGTGKRIMGNYGRLSNKIPGTRFASF